MSSTAPDAARVRIKPADPLESMLVDIWADLLARRPVPVSEAFSSLGGTSALAGLMVDRVERACGVSLPAAIHPGALTIVELARAIKAEAAAAGRSERPGLIARNLPRPGRASRPDLFFLHGDFNGGGLYCLALAAHIGRDQPFYGLAPHGLGGAALPPTIEAMAADYLRTLQALRPRGPYRLAGHCNGALVAFEIARRLAGEGVLIDRLVLVSPRLPAERRRPTAESLRRIAARGRRLFSGGPAPPPPTSSDPLTDAYRAVMAAYAPGPLEGPVTLLWPEDEDADIRERSTRVWRRAAPGLDARLVPGAHLTCVTTHAPALGQAIRECLGPEAPPPPR